MNTTIRWPVNERLCFLGRNGYGKCTGLEISEFEGIVEIRPITSKNEIGRSELCVPFAALPQLIKILRRLRRTRVKKTTPTLQKSEV